MASILPVVAAETGVDTAVVSSKPKATKRDRVEKRSILRPPARDLKPSSAAGSKSHPFEVKREHFPRIPSGEYRIMFRAGMSTLIFNIKALFQ
jgi:hypothetical protein